MLVLLLPKNQVYLRQWNFLQILFNGPFRFKRSHFSRRCYIVWLFCFLGSNGEYLWFLIRFPWFAPVLWFHFISLSNRFCIEFLRTNWFELVHLILHVISAAKTLLRRKFKCRVCLVNVQTFYQFHSLFLWFKIFEFLTLSLKVNCKIILLCLRITSLLLM